AADLVQHHRRQKRGGGKVQGESAFLVGQGGNSSTIGMEQVLGREPTPEFASQVAEEYHRLLDLLGDEKLRLVATMKMEGYADKEVAEKLSCGLRTVERKLERIRSIWAKEMDQ